MKKRKKQKRGLGVAVVAAVIAVASVAAWFCLRGVIKGSANAASVLPRELSLVGRVNLRDVAVTNGVGWDEIRAFLTSDNETGISVSATHYAFASGAYFGMVVALDDAHDFAAFLQKRGSQVEQQRGLQWAVEGTALIAFDKHKALIMGPSTVAGENELRTAIHRLMTQDAEQSGARSELFALLSEEKAPIAAVMDGSALPLDLISQAGVTLPHGLTPADYRYAFGLTFKAETVTLSTAIEDRTPAAMEYLTQVDVNQLVADIQKRLDIPFLPIRSSVVRDNLPGKATVGLEVDLTSLAPLMKLAPNGASLGALRQLGLYFRDVRHMQLQLKANEGTDILKTVIGTCKELN